MSVPRDYSSDRIAMRQCSGSHDARPEEKQSGMLRHGLSCDMIGNASTRRWATRHPTRPTGNGERTTRKPEPGFPSYPRYFQHSREGLRLLGRAGGELSTAARAGAWLRENLDRPYRVEELAAAVGLSISSVNRSFRRTTRLSPLPYQNPTTWSENRFRDGTVPHPSQPAQQQSLSQRLPQP